MKIKIAFLGSYNNTGIGGGDRKFEIYFNNLSHEYFDKYFLYVTKDATQVADHHEKIVILEQDIDSFLDLHKIEYIYFAGAKLNAALQKKLTKDHVGLINVNFTPLYDSTGQNINLIISQTDYRKLFRMHGKLMNSYVVYNPVDVDNRIKLSAHSIGKYRDTLKNKKYIIGRIARAEPSKRHFLILGTLVKLQFKKNYTYGFIFAGMPLLYRKALKILLNKKMYASILFLPELKKLEDIATFYKSIDLFWQTSWIGESFGNVIAEAFCFQVPVITDFKGFYSHGKINKNLYDAQIELVDHEINGGYCATSESVVNFLETHTKNDIKKLGKNGFQKAKNLYDVKDTTITLAKILYDIGKERGLYNTSDAFESLVQKPSFEDIEAYQGVYLQKLSLARKINKLSILDKFVYVGLNNVRRLLELVYLLYRKIAKQVFHKNIETF